MSVKNFLTGWIQLVKSDPPQPLTADEKAEFTREFERINAVQLPSDIVLTGVVYPADQAQSAVNPTVTFQYGGEGETK